MPSIGDDDRDLLRRFVAGELDGPEISALEHRLDAEPDLQQCLARLAREGMGDVVLSDVRTTWASSSDDEGRTTVEIQGGIELDDEIGRGGMGVVHRATQRSVGRTVAVKTVRDVVKHGGPLLQEAFVTGHLEHPNIVPIHEITQDEESRPLVVLKHIEGTVWRETFAFEGAATKPLEWHVKVLSQVCQALRFAHSRGIIHRDVKPSNVMIGLFDEVYLLDWGLALSIADHDKLPTRAEARGVAGTPAYMAPEQFEELPEKVSEVTDVYLVGACLFHAIVGKPPQSGYRLSAIRDAVRAREKVEMPPTTPKELVEIVNRAMAIDMADRFPNIAELRNALEAFLEHRGSLALVEKADERAKEMADAHHREDKDAAGRAFFDAAFSYRAALESWPDNREAQRNIASLVSRRVRHLIAIHAPMAAARSLSVVETPDRDLAEEVDRAVREERANRARLRDYDEGHDRRVGLKTRRFLGGAIGAAWVVLWIWVSWSPPATPLPLLIGGTVFLLLSVALVWRARAVMLRLRLNRYNTWVTLSAIVAMVVLFGAATFNHRPVEAVLVEMMLMFSLSASCAAVVVDRRIFPTSLTYGLGYLLCSVNPSWLRWALPIGAVVTVVTSLTMNVLTARESAAADDGRVER